MLSIVQISPAIVKTKAVLLMISSEVGRSRPSARTVERAVPRYLHEGVGQGVLEMLELVHVSAPRGAGNSYFAEAWGVGRTPRGELRLSGNPIRRSSLRNRGSWRTGS
jgi:hypothetical protein